MSLREADPDQAQKGARRQRRTVAGREVSEEDSATGGLDLKRGILPNVLVVTADGVEEISDEDLAAIAQPILDGRP